VDQFGECNSDWGTTLGVVKARPYFLFIRRGDHILDDGSNIKDGAIPCILFGGFVAAEKRPPRRLRAFESERYEASVCMCNIMSEA
jgi:hypothetical protein